MRCGNAAEGAIKSFGAGRGGDALGVERRVRRAAAVRVFHDVTETKVQILAVVTKEHAQAWLDEQGTREDDAKSSGAGGSEG